MDVENAIRLLGIHKSVVLRASPPAHWPQSLTGILPPIPYTVLHLHVNIASDSAHYLLLSCTSQAFGKATPNSPPLLGSQTWNCLTSATESVTGAGSVFPRPICQTSSPLASAQHFTSPSPPQWLYSECLSKRWPGEDVRVLESDTLG